MRELVQARWDEGISLLEGGNMTAFPPLEALALVERDMKIPAGRLQQYAGEDVPGGYEQGWAPGSAWGADLLVLYCMLRYFRPEHVLEIGTADGCSASTIAMALKRNGHGDLTSIDIVPGAGANYEPQEGVKATFINHEGVAWVSNGGMKNFDFVFEDGPHYYGYTRDILTAIEVAIRPTVLVSHDCAVPESLGNYGIQITRAWSEIIGDFNTVIAEPSPCGLAYRRL